LLHRWARILRAPLACIIAPREHACQSAARRALLLAGADDLQRDGMYTWRGRAHQSDV